MAQLDWNHLIFGSYSQSQIAWAVNDAYWQSIRMDMVKESLSVKYDTLVMYLDTQKHSLKSKIQVTNYVNALKRGGLIE